MKKPRMSKKAKETLKRISEIEREIHVCLPHLHDRMKCSLCMSVYMRGWTEACKTEPVPGKEVIHKTYWPIPVVCGILCIGLGYFFGWSSPIWIPPTIEKPYVVYRPDKETDAKLADCQDSWKADQIEKKLLRLKIKSIEIPE